MTYQHIYDAKHSYVPSHVTNIWKKINHFDGQTKHKTITEEGHTLPHHMSSQKKSCLVVKFLQALFYVC